MQETNENAPVIESFQYETKQKEFVVCIDTMGKDSEIGESYLSFIESKVDFFRQQWEAEEYKMLLDDILQFLEDEPSLEGQSNYLRDQEQAFISANESQIKEQFANHEKES